MTSDGPSYRRSARPPDAAAPRNGGPSCSRVLTELPMANEAEIAKKFWKALRSDRTVMLGLAGVDEGHAQPMTALVEDDRDAGPIWIFSARTVDLVKALGPGGKALAHFVSKDHELFASVHGELVPDDDRAAIDRLWNPFVAAWYPGGKDDPELRLLRFDPEWAQVWLNEDSLFSALKLMLGRDPKREYRDKVADVNLAR
jgi:general stress protein 26